MGDESEEKLKEKATDVNPNILVVFILRVYTFICVVDFLLQ